MAEYTRTDNPNFNVKEEIKRLKKKIASKNWQLLGEGERRKVTKEFYKDKKANKEIIVKVDKNTGRKYYWDTKLNKEVSRWGSLFNRYGGKSLDDQIKEYWHAKYNIPTHADKQQAYKDIEYLEARLRYEQREEFRTKKLPRLRYDEKGKTSQYDENIRIDKEKGNLTDEGIPISQAQWDGKTNQIETDMVNKYENSSYKDKDFNSLNIKVQNKAKEEKKKKEEEAAYYTKPPKEKVNRYMDIAKEQYKLDTTVNKNPMRDSIKVGPKDVGKTHSLDKLLGLQIEQ